MGITRLSKTEFGKTLPFNRNISSRVVQRLEKHFPEMLETNVSFSNFYWPSAMAAIEPLVEQYGDSPRLIEIALDEKSINHLITSANIPGSITAIRWSILDVVSHDLCLPSSKSAIDHDIIWAAAESIGEVVERSGQLVINYDTDGVVFGRVMLNRQEIIHEYLCRTIPFNDDDSCRPDYEWPIKPRAIF
jgi:hypothetical protein